MQLRGMLAAVLAMCCGMENACGKGSSSGILVATSGSIPFSDSVWLLSNNGGVANRVLAPSQSESYPYAFGRSMDGPFLIGVHRNTGTSISDTLAIFSSGFLHPRALDGCDAQFVFQGYGAFDGSNKRVVFSGKKAGETNDTLWVCNIELGKLQQVTLPTGAQTWDSYPAWTPDGNNILYLRITRSRSGLASNLWSVSLNSGSISMVTAAPVAAFCFSPDGNSVGAITADGIDLFRWPDFALQRHLVPWRTLKQYAYSGGTISFAADPPQILIPFSQAQVTHIFSVNPTTGEIADLRQMQGMATSLAWLSK